MSKKKFCFFVSTGRHNKEVLIFRQARALEENGYEVEYVVNDNEEETVVDDLRIIPTGYGFKGY